MNEVINQPIYSCMYKQSIPVFYFSYPEMTLSTNTYFLLNCTCMDIKYIERRVNDRVPPRLGWNKQKAQ